MISIILPIKNINFDYYKRCLNSILSQQFRDFEVIIKHNGSKDEFNLIKSLTNDSRFVYINKPDTCFANAANQGMEAAKGDLINLFCHDDVYIDNALQKVHDSIDDHLWYFGFIKYYVNNNQVGTYYKPDPTIKDMQINNLIPQPSCFFKREIYEKIGKFDENFFLLWDYDYWIRIMKKYPPKTIYEYLARYYLNSNSISIKHEDKMSIEKTRIFEKHFK